MGGSEDEDQDNNNNKDKESGGAMRDGDSDDGFIIVNSDQINEGGLVYGY